LFYVDYDGSQSFTVRQLGQIFQILGVFKFLLNEKKPTKSQLKLQGYKELEKKQREEQFLENCWNILNPIGGQDTIEGNVL